MSVLKKVADFPYQSEQISEPIFTREERITPEKAKQWLEMNHHNRPLSDVYCNELARDMKEGRWHVNGESIKFDSSGFLIDGQHRLKAVVRSGCTIDTCVTYNIYDSEAFKYIDEVKKRTAGYLMAASGSKNAIPKASGTRLVYQVVHCDNLKRLRLYKKRIHNCDLADFAEQISEIDEAVALSSVLVKISTRAVITASAVVLLRINPDQARSFFEKLQTGFFPERDDPVQVLRDQLLIRENPKQAAEILENLALIFKAWNLSVNGKTCKKLVWRFRAPGREAFPVPEGFEQAWRVKA